MTTTIEDTGAAGGFAVHLDVFEGPFDVLLSLIAKRRLDVTLVALSQVTDEFLAFIRACGEDWDLDQASEFLVIAATLLDLKVSRLLPSAVADDEEDLALLEARDLLFARLLQYRAYKQISGWLAQRWAAQGHCHPRSVSLEPQFADLVPPTVLGVGPQELAALLAHAERPRPVPVIDIDHIHAPAVSVREQAAIIADRLRSVLRSTFRGLIADCTSTLEVVARFLAVLELYREGLVGFDQIEPLGELQITWSGRDESADADAGDADRGDHRVDIAAMDIDSYEVNDGE